MGIFSREISQLLKISPPPSLTSHLSSSPKDLLLRDYGTHVYHTFNLLFMTKGFMGDMRREGLWNVCYSQPCKKLYTSVLAECGNQQREIASAKHNQISWTNSQ